MNSYSEHLLKLREHSRKAREAANATAADMQHVHSVPTSGNIVNEVHAPVIAEKLTPATTIVASIDFSQLKSKISTSAETRALTRLSMLNEDQRAAVDLAVSGESFALSGSAGSGKTFTSATIVSEILRSGRLGLIDFSTKYLRSNTPAIVAVAFTRRAAHNLEKNFTAAGVHIPVLTIHKLCEYVPTEKENTRDDGSTFITKPFLPTYTEHKKLPRIDVIIWEESGLISRELYHTAKLALNHNYGAGIQEIFVGDIHQLPPPMGESIIREKVVKLRAIELTKIYRQADTSPIIILADDIRNGLPITKEKYKFFAGKTHEIFGAEVRIGNFPATISNTASEHTAFNAAMATLKAEYEKGVYVPEDCMILIPYRRPKRTDREGKERGTHFCTTNANIFIADLIDIRHERTVHEILVGFEKKYFAIGDKVLAENQDYVIEAIVPSDTEDYDVCAPSIYLSRNGEVREELLNSHVASGRISEETAKAVRLNITRKAENDASVDDIFANIDFGNEDKMEQLSHRIYLRALDVPADARNANNTSADWDKLVANSYGDYMCASSKAALRALDFGYANTFDSSQGLQAERVYVMHHTIHRKYKFREAIYTAVTRAQKHVTILCAAGDASILESGVQNPRIPGITLHEKKAFLSANSVFPEFDYGN